MYLPKLSWLKCWLCPYPYAMILKLLNVRISEYFHILIEVFNRIKFFWETGLEVFFKIGSSFKIRLGLGPSIT